MPSPETPRHLEASLLCGHCSFLLGPGERSSVVPSRSLWIVAYQPPQSMEFSRQEYWSGLPFPSPRDLPNPGIEPGCPALQADALPSEPPGKPHSGVNGDILQEDFCHTHTQSPYPCGRPLLICTSTGNTQTQFLHSLCVVPGSCCTQGLFEPSEHLWQEQGLILNVNSLLLLFCWGFSFALGCGVSPHSRSSAYHLMGVFLTLEWWPHGAGAATGWEEIPHVQGHSGACASLEQPWRDIPCPRSGAVAALHWTSLRRYPMSK